MEENRNGELPFPPIKYTRPIMLVILCILTFISSGTNFISYLVMPHLPNYLSHIDDSIYQSLPTDMFTVFEEIMMIPDWKFYALACCCLGSIVGAAMLLKLKLEGFHVYAISKFLNLIIALTMIPNSTFSLNSTAIIITLLIIGLYFIYYYQIKKTKELNKLRNSNNEERGF